MVIICICVVKPKGASLPSKEIFTNCFNSNPDGAGFLYVVDGIVNIEKGFMVFEDFWNRITSINIDKKNTLMGFHFRIKTHGTVSPENTHPFPVSTEMQDLKQLSFQSEKAIIHNGVISKFKGTLYNSDTQEFVTEFLAPLNEGASDWLDNKPLTRLVYNVLESKMAVFTKDGRCKLFGEWTKDNGIYYSNTSYKYDVLALYKVLQNNSKGKIIKNIMPCKDQNIYLLSKKDYTNKIYGNDILRIAKDCLVSIDTQQNVYVYDSKDGIYKKRQDLIVISKYTKVPLKFMPLYSEYEYVDM